MRFRQQFLCVCILVLKKIFSVSTLEIDFLEIHVENILSFLGIHFEFQENCFGSIVFFIRIFTERNAIHLNSKHKIKNTTRLNLNYHKNDIPIICLFHKKTGFVNVLKNLLIRRKTVVANCSLQLEIVKIDLTKILISN